MKPINLNRKSWHYRLAEVYGQYREYDEWGDAIQENLNICVYTKFVVIGGLIALLITIVLLAVGFAVIDLGVWLAAMLSMKQYIEPTAAAAVGGLALASITLGILGVFMSEFTGISKMTNKIVNTVEDSFVGNAYAAFKDKVCLRINFK